MAGIKRFSNEGQRSRLAYSTLIFSGLAITVLAVVGIINNPENTMTIFNIVLPVFASWVGTILAFYFGRENFESANKQVREMVQRLSPDERAQKPVTAIMRPFSEMVYLQLPSGKTEKDITLAEFTGKFSGSISRMPIVDSARKPKYIVHESSINKFIATGGKETDTLEKFIETQKKAGFVFDVQKGFVLVPEQATLAMAKQKMEEIPSCQDIFITKSGSPNEPLLGWISNIRMAKYLNT